MLINYIPRQPKLTKHNINENLIVSMTTTPERINKIWPTINSTLRQTILPKKIFLWIPKRYKRFTSSIKSIPNFLRHPLIETCFIDTDYGPATKILPTLELRLDPTLDIIIIDDDRIYHENTFLELLTLKLSYPNAAVSIAGITFNTQNYKEHLNPKFDQQVDSLLGYAGFCISPWMFDQTVFSYPENNRSVFYEDDIWISGNLRRKHIQIWQPRRAYSKFSHQNLLLNNHIHRQFALCMSENKDKSNLLEAWAYFENKA